MPGFALGRCVGFKHFWPLVPVLLALAASVFVAFSVWPLWLTGQSSRPAFGGRLTLFVSLRKTRFIKPHVLFTGVYLLKRLFVGFWVSRRASPLGAAPVSSLFGF